MIGTVTLEADAWRYTATMIEELREENAALRAKVEQQALKIRQQQARLVVEQAAGA